MHEQGHVDVPVCEKCHKERVTEHFRNQGYVDCALNHYQMPCIHCGNSSDVTVCFSHDVDDNGVPLPPVEYMANPNRLSSDGGGAEEPRVIHERIKS